MLKIAILTRPLNSSPKVLAECLTKALENSPHTVHTYSKLQVFKRLIIYRHVKHKYNYLLWLLYKIVHYFQDQIFLKRLKQYDILIITDTTPIAFQKETYNIEKLRKVLNGTPILYYAVFYLGNAPTKVAFLQSQKEHTFERFDWHLSVSKLTEIKSPIAAPWTPIGLYMKGTDLRPQAKKEFLAVVDFKRPGYEHFRATQIKVLEELNIPYISLDRPFTVEEIRQIYRQASMYFLQFPESFGMPIAECLCCGSFVMTPDSSWPMSWRLNEEPRLHGPGKLPECFIVYDNEEDLKEKLRTLQAEYHLEKTPQKVFDIFYEHYPSYFDGNLEALEEVFAKVKNRQLPPNRKSQSTKAHHKTAI